MCRTRRNEQGVDEHVDHEPARAATCKTELTVPKHYGKHINFLYPSSVTGDCLHDGHSQPVRTLTVQA